LFADLTVQDNLRLGSLHRRRNLAERQKAVLKYFPVLLDRLHQRAGTLSGGEQKALILTRALIPEPNLLILDEISEGLQPSLLMAARHALEEERHRRDMTLVLVEQNVDFALALADRVAVMNVGELTLEAASADPGVRDSIVQAFNK
jgi:branched-chain amino acid transport system ATP-binding protein